METDSSLEIRGWDGVEERPGLVGVDAKTLETAKRGRQGAHLDIAQNSPNVFMVSSTSSSGNVF